MTDQRVPDQRVPEQRASEQRFAQLMLPHLDAAYSLARWLLGDASQAQDVAQDAMLRALGYFASYRGGDARAWLLRIVRNAAYDAIRARRKLPPELEFHDIDPADDPETAYLRSESAGRLDQALAALPVELRECLVLREIEELSYKEIGCITGLPIGTVMSRLWRARRALLQSAPVEAVR